MKARSGRPKHVKREGGPGVNRIKIHKAAQCQEKSAVSPTQPHKTPLPEHLINYNDIVVQLIKRKAHYLSPYENNSSYEEWSKTQDKIAFYQASSPAIEDVLKARIELTRQKFIENLNWKTLDIINYLISSNPDVAPSAQSAPSCMRENLSSLQKRNPIVLTASIRKTTKAGLNDSSKPAGTPKTAPKKTSSSKSGGTPAQPTLAALREPTYPKKYKPTYNLSNYDYVKKGWTKLPDYSVTYRYYTLGTEPAFPALWAFRIRTDGRKDYYPNSTKMSADFEGEKPYFIYYPNGEVAISISEGRAGPRLIVYSMSKKDATGRWVESRPQAMFDSKGNGVIYDLEGRMRMNFDQIEGAKYSYGTNARPVLHWYWKESTYLRMRRDDLSVVPPDHNDDIDPNRPEGDSRKSRASRSRGSKKRSRGDPRETTDKRKSKTPRKSKTGKDKGQRKSKVSRKSVARKSMARKSKVSQGRKSKISQGRKSKMSVKSAKGAKSNVKSATQRKSETLKGKSRRKSAKKPGGPGKKSMRVDVPPLRRKPRRMKPITEIAPLAIKITDYVSMRIMNQQHIHLDYECGTVHYRFYLGINVKPETVERIDRIVNPKKADNIAPCYFELMPLRSYSLYNTNKKLQEMRKEAARREYKKNIRSLGGFYAWWLKKKKIAAEKIQNQQFQNPPSTHKKPV